MWLCPGIHQYISVHQYIKQPTKSLNQLVFQSVKSITQAFSFETGHTANRRRPAGPVYYVNLLTFGLSMARLLNAARAILSPPGIFKWEGLLSLWPINQSINQSITADLWFPSVLQRLWRLQCWIFWTSLGSANPGETSLVNDEKKNLLQSNQNKSHFI